MTTKVTHIQDFNGTNVTKGKLVLIKYTETNLYVRSIDYKSFIVSESQEENRTLKDGELCLDMYGNIGGHVDLSEFGLSHGMKKVLATHEQFTPEQLKMIADEKLKDGDDVFIECGIQDLSDTIHSDITNVIKLDANEKITLLPIPKPSNDRSRKPFIIANIGSSSMGRYASALRPKFGDELIMINSEDALEKGIDVARIESLQNNEILKPASPRPIESNSWEKPLTGRESRNKRRKEGRKNKKK